MIEQRDSPSLLSGFCWRQDCLGCRSWARDSGFSSMLGRGERNLTQFFPWYSPMVTAGSSALKGSGLLPSTSAVGYHSLPGKRLQSHQNCWTTQHLGDRDAIYQLTFAYSGLSWLISPPAHFFLLAAAWKQAPAFLWSSREKILGCKAESHNLVHRPASPGWLPATGSFRCGDFLLRVFLLPLQILREMHFESGSCW